MNVCHSSVIRRLNVLQSHGHHMLDSSKLRFRPKPTVLQRKDISSLDASELASQVEDEELHARYPLTKSEALSFLERVLKIPNAESLCQENRIAFLNQITERMNRAIPFSNVVLLGRDRDERVAPTTAECKREALACRGGSCFIINSFNKTLLELLGFKCHLIPGNDPFSEFKGTHVGLLLEDLRYPGSKDIVEAGTKRPLFEAIPLKFKEESPEYQFGHVRSKFIKERGGQVSWFIEISQDSEKTRNVVSSRGKKWEKQMTYEVDVTWPFPLLNKMHTLVWPNPHIVPEVHSCIRVGGYSSVSCQQFVAIKGKEVTVVHEDLSEERFVAGSKAELVEMFQKYYPQFTKEMVIKAIDNTIESW